MKLKLSFSCKERTEQRVYSTSTMNTGKISTGMLFVERTQTTVPVYCHILHCKAIGE